MRVLLVTPDFPPNIDGGCGVSASLLADMLRSRGVHVDVLAFTGDGLPQEDTGEGTVTYLPKPRTYALLNDLTRRVMRERLDHDIVHVYNTVQLPAACSFDVPVVATLNNIDLICPNPSHADPRSCLPYSATRCLACCLRNHSSFGDLADRLQKWANIRLLQSRSKRGDAYLSLSLAMRRYYEGAGYPMDRVTVVPNMVEPREPTTRVVSDVPTLLYVGRMGRDKGVQDLIAAFHDVDGDARLVLVGSGTDEAEFRRLADGRRGDDIVFTGRLPRDEVSHLYDGAHAMVHPAIWPEPFPRTILEAMSHSLPVVASDAGSHPEVLDDLSLMYPRGDVDALRDRLEEVLRRGPVVDHSERLSMYRPDRVMDAIIDVYRRLMGGDA